MEKQKAVFQASVYLTLALSALILAQAEGAALPQGVTLPLALVTWIFNERRGTLRIPTWLANLLGMAGFLAAMAELLFNSIEGRLLSGAHLLVYLSWVVLLQRKEARQYLWMLTLSLLQVAVGAVLTTSETYGALVALFFCMSIWTLSLFTLWQSSERARSSGRIMSGGGGAGPSESPPADNPFAGLFRASAARGGAQHDGQGRVTIGRFLLGSLTTSCACLVMSIAFFILIPRAWIGAPTFGAEAAVPAALSVTGFSGEVTLGDIGRILESNEPVLTLTLYDNDTRETISPNEYAEKMGWDEPLFRGAVLINYENGQWKRGKTSPTIGLPRDPPPGERRVRQEIRMMPIKTNALLAMTAVAECKFGDHSQNFFPITGVIARPTPHERTQISYTVCSPHPEDKSILGYIPISVITARFPELARRIRESCLQIPPRLERLAAEARRVSGVAGDDERPTDREIADRIVAYLRDSGQFSYSLDASIKNPNLDPIEDFLLERKQGHCEYFASSLALMLRAVDIPSRLVSGFKGGTPNSITGGYDVQQRHAHAWVEALIDDRWVTLDATPSAPREDVVSALDPGLPKITEIMNLLRDTWNAYVLNLSMGHQNDRFYEPAKSAAKSLWESLKGDEQERAAVLIAIKRFLSSPEEWFSWKGGLATLFLGGLASGLYWLVGATIQWMRRWTGLRKLDETPRERTIAFYERFRLLCSKHGLERDPAQTQREFGDAVAAAWSGAPTAALSGGTGWDGARADGPFRDRSGHDGAEAGNAGTNGTRTNGTEANGTEANGAKIAGEAAHVPALLAEVFYRVRFGDGDLNEAEATEIDRALDLLERALAAKNAIRRG